MPKVALRFVVWYASPTRKSIRGRSAERAASIPVAASAAWSRAIWTRGLSRAAISSAWRSDSDMGASCARTTAGQT